MDAEDPEAAADEKTPLKKGQGKEDDGDGEAQHWIRTLGRYIPPVLIALHFVLLRGLAAYFKVSNEETVCTRTERLWYLLEAGFVLLASFVLVILMNIKKDKEAWRLRKSSARVINWYKGVPTPEDKLAREVPFYTACCNCTTFLHRGIVIFGESIVSPTDQLCSRLALCALRDGHWMDVCRDRATVDLLHDGKRR